MQNGKTITVFSVLFHNDATPYAGAAGDGSFIQRFRRESDAKAFAASREYNGRPCTVQREDGVPKRIAARWSVA